MTDPTDSELERLGRATDGVRPTPGFSARVMGAVQAEPSSLLDLVWSSSRRLMPLAAAAAVAAVMWAVQIEGQVNEAIAVEYGAGEVDW